MRHCWRLFEIKVSYLIPQNCYILLLWLCFLVDPTWNRIIHAKRILIWHVIGPTDMWISFPQCSGHRSWPHRLQEWTKHIGGNKKCGLKSETISVKMCWRFWAEVEKWFTASFLGLLPSKVIAAGWADEMVSKRRRRRPLELHPWAVDVVGMSTGVPKTGWFIMFNPIEMMTGGTLVSENHHINHISTENPSKMPQKISTNFYKPWSFHINVSFRRAKKEMWPNIIKHNYWSPRDRSKLPGQCPQIWGKTPGHCRAFIFQSLAHQFLQKTYWKL